MAMAFKLVAMPFVLAFLTFPACAASSSEGCAANGPEGCTANDPSTLMQARVNAHSAHSEPIVSCKMQDAMIAYSVDESGGLCSQSCVTRDIFEHLKNTDRDLKFAEEGISEPCRQNGFKSPTNIEQVKDVHYAHELYKIKVDFYRPEGMPDLSCCLAPDDKDLCIQRDHQSLKVLGTGPYCCSSFVSDTAPCIPPGQ